MSLSIGRRSHRLLFEPVDTATDARRLTVLQRQTSQVRSASEPAHGTIRVRLETEEARDWSLALGGRWRVHERSRARLLWLNGPLASCMVDGAEVQTWRWEDATA